MHRSVKYLYAIIIVLALPYCVHAIYIGVPAEYAATPRDSLIIAFNRAGYWEAKIDSIHGDTVFVSRGRPAIAESIAIACADSIETLIEHGIVFRRADIVALGAIIAQQDKFVTILENNGYPFASCTTAASMRDTSGKIFVKLEFVVDEGPFVRLGRLDAQVVGRTKSSVIANAMLFAPGRPYHQRHIDKGTLRLRRLGIVSLSGEPYPAIDPQGVWALVIKGSDLPTTAISGMLAYAEDRFSGDMEISAKNIFGTGRRARFYIYASESNRKIELLYREPFMWHVNVSPEFYSLWELYDSTYSRRKHKLGIGFPLSFELDGYVGMTTGRTVPGVAGGSLPQSEQFGIEGALTFSTLDNPVLPQKGIHIEGGMTGEYIHRWGAQNTEELGIQGNASGLVLVPATGWLDIWLRAAGWGWIAPTLPPQSDWEYIGGWKSLRGYREDQFAGIRLLWGSCEPRLVPVRDFHIFPFADFGAYRNDEKWNAKFGYGAGIEYLFGAGVFSIEYGIGEGRSLRNGLLHFGIRMEL